MLRSKHFFIGLASLAILGCSAMAPQQEFSPELQRSLVPLYIAADMEDVCRNVSWDENGYNQYESKVLSLAAQMGVSAKTLVEHMNSDNWMTVEEAYFFGFLQEYEIKSIEDYDERICSIARNEDRKNSDVGKMIIVR